jgi:hypothetical protein
MLACWVTTLTLFQLILAPVIIGAAAANVWQSRRMRRRAEQYWAASRAAAQLTSAVVAKAGPWLDCEVCGARLDPRGPQGVELNLDPQGQLHLLCSEHAHA